jgi:hypothetical protein
VEDHELRWSRRLLGLPLVTLEPPPPPLRRKLHQQGSFEATGSQEIMPDQHPKESTILDLGAKAFGLVETSTTDLSACTIVLIHPYEFQTVSHTAMETNVVTPSGNSSNPTMVAPQESFHLLIHRHRSEPPWSRLPLHRTVVQSYLWRWPQPLSHQVQQALRSHTGCLVHVQVMYFPTPLHRLQV